MKFFTKDFFNKFTENCKRTFIAFSQKQSVNSVFDEMKAQNITETIKSVLLMLTILVLLVLPLTSSLLLLPLLLTHEVSHMKNLVR